TVALLARRRRMPPGSPVQLLLETGLVLLTTFLVSGSTWLHHLVGLAVPLVALTGIALHSGGPHRRPAAAAVAAILVLLTVRPADVVDWVAGMLPGVPLAAWLASNMALGVVLAGWAACAWLLTHEPPSLSGWYNEGETTGRKAPVSTLPSRAATTKGSPRTSEV
ncbi:MAG TPA: hypothetical protein VM536_16370, partial [Chloroflexia bacterium]|nr:hypothetical protein [Chloroflexia bacterium]